MQYVSLVEKVVKVEREYRLCFLIFSFMRLQLFKADQNDLKLFTMTHHHYEASFFTMHRTKWLPAY